MTNDYYKIRPAARLITSIGEGLIKDVPAAIVELVKNSYDADADFVEITFFVNKEKGNENLEIIIKDNGHGMSFDTVINKWMVPATSDKLKRKKSMIKKRIMQGRKGIGRYASAILGDKLKLKTIDLSGNKTIAYIDWDEFEKKQFLTDVEILIKEYKSTCEPEIIAYLKKENKASSLEEIIEDINDNKILNQIIKSKISGTELSIYGDKGKLEEWTDFRINALINDLKKLLSPLKNIDKNKDEFKIYLEFKGFNSAKYSNFKEEVQPYPLIELYDYRIHGEVDEIGTAKLTYINNTESKIKETIKPFKIYFDQDEKYCGPVKIDFRVFDKDPESIDNLIHNKGILRNSSDKSLGKNEAKKLIKDISGVGIYRGDFRIRPYGDKGYDWLELDKDRVQNPSKKIGNDQVVGFINIASEEISKLEEKSARDGLKENSYYDGLYEISKRVLLELENRRYTYRRKTGKGRKTTKVQDQLEILFNFNDLSDQLENKLNSLNIKNEDIVEFKKIIKDSEEEKTELLKDIQDTIATYQGQATLGKIIMVIQHEGRRPIGYIKNAVPLIKLWGEKLKKESNMDSETLDRLIEKINVTNGELELISNLFSKIDPLSQKRRSKAKIIPVLKSIEEVKGIFEYQLKTNNISFNINFSASNKIKGWKEDFIIALTNLIENSIYWLSHSQKNHRTIDIFVFDDEDHIVIDLKDNGIGIEEKLIEEEIIFEPNFSTKTDGMGLGLAIAGEAIARNDGKLKAFYNENGAHFRIELKGISKEDE